MRIEDLGMRTEGFKTPAAAGKISLNPKPSTLKSLLIALAFLLQGCSLGASVDSLLSPPMLTYEQAEIYDALMKSVGSQRLSLVYPSDGDYRSAFIIESIDGAGELALVFYESGGGADGESGIRMNILTKENEKWRSVYDHAGIGFGVDKVIFSSLGNTSENASSGNNIIIGFNLLSGEKSFRVYRFEGGILESLYGGIYSRMFIADLDADGESGLIVISPNNPAANSQAHISIIKERGGEVVEISSVPLNPDTSDIVNVVYGLVGEGRRALFIDSLAGGMVKTEIIYTINGELRNPLYLSGSDILEDTLRPAGYLCTDIDGDLIIEIPTLSLFPGHDADSEESFYITNWNVFENFSIIKKYASLYNTAEGYCFIIPSRWESVVTVKSDRAAGDIVFHRYPSDGEAELMRFSAVRSGDVFARLEAGYTVIRESERFTYMVKLPEDNDDPLILTNTEILNNLYIMEQRG
ncbi:MAG: hypothetical protein FWG90_08690 [Oscillospiraceae bacterium]|nr:hypothetical protein [Oscillospiraceae bacterium]